MSTRGLRSSDVFLVTVTAIHMGRVLRVPRNPASPHLPLAEFEGFCKLNKKADCKLSARALGVCTNVQRVICNGAETSWFKACKTACHRACMACTRPQVQSLIERGEKRKEKEEGGGEGREREREENEGE